MEFLFPYLILLRQLIIKINFFIQFIKFIIYSTVCLNGELTNTAVNPKAKKLKTSWRGATRKRITISRVKTNTLSYLKRSRRPKKYIKISSNSFKTKICINFPLRIISQLSRMVISKKEKTNSYPLNISLNRSKTSLN